MTLKRKTNNTENAEYWEFIDKTAKKVENYPAWKRGGGNADNAKSEENPRKICEPNDSLPKYDMS